MALRIVVLTVVFQIVATFAPKAHYPMHRVKSTRAKIEISDWAKEVEGGELRNDKYYSAADLSAKRAEESDEAKLKAFKAQRIMQRKRMELFVESGPSGSGLSDCPSSMFVRSVLHIKGLECKVTMCAPESIPKWLVDGYGGQLPALIHDGEAYAEPLVIARYLDFFFAPPLEHASTAAATAAEVATSAVFPALNAFVLNSKAEADAALERELVEVLVDLDSHLEAIANEVVPQ
jgi:hypothetical protein